MKSHIEECHRGRREGDDSVKFLGKKDVKISIDENEFVGKDRKMSLSYPGVFIISLK